MSWVFVGGGCCSWPRPPVTAESTFPAPRRQARTLQVRALVKLNQEIDLSRGSARESLGVVFDSINLVVPSDPEFFQSVNIVLSFKKILQTVPAYNKAFTSWNVMPRCKRLRVMKVTVISPLLLFDNSLESPLCVTVRAHLGSGLTEVSYQEEMPRSSF